MTGLQVIENGRITDSSSTVPISHVENVTASRWLNAGFVNTTGKTLFVSITLDFKVTTLAGRAMAYGKMGVGTGIIIMAASGIVDCVIVNMRLLVEMFFPVSPGETYRVDTDLLYGLIDVYSWIESY